MSQNPLALSTTGPLPGLTAVTGINNAFDSLSRWLSGPMAPTAAGLGLSSLAGVVWHDTAANALKVRDQADSAWITIGSFDEANKLFQAAYSVKTDGSLRQSSGGLSVNEAITLVSANQTITAASHFANLVASAAVTLTLAQASTLGNGACAFSLSAQGGAVTLTPNAADSIVVGQTIQAAGASYVLAQGSSTFVVCDGAGKWYLLFLNSPAVQPPAYRNLLINGGFDIWQRGTSFSAAGYTADRWQVSWVSGTVLVAPTQETQPLTDRPYGQLFGIVATSVVGGLLFQQVEDVRVGSNQTLTLSYYTAMGSGADTGPVPYLIQNFGSGGSVGVYVTAASDTAVGNRRILTFNVPAITGKTIGVGSCLHVVIPFSGTFSGYHWGVQLEIGATPTAFEALPVDVTLARCLRYYEKGNAFLRSYYGTAGTSIGVYVPFKAVKRAIPTVTITNVSAINVGATPTNEGSFVDGFYLVHSGTSATISTYTDSWTANAEF